MTITWIVARSQPSKEWEADLDPTDPDNYWIDRETGERVNAHTGKRTPRARGPRA